MSTIPWFQSLRENLAATLSRNGLTQAELSRRSGVHEVTISRIIHGHLEPTVTTAEKLARAAGISAEKLFAEKLTAKPKSALTTP
jgi:transcriptional regulator with XRE-family HTH domain